MSKQDKLKEKAECARRHLTHYMNESGGSTDWDSAMSDFLADLMHLASQRGMNFEEELERARSYYEAELEEEE